ncbi:hypothetical protein [Acidiplasma cupricumulans]|uniref:hypothetical protein n=1 Tax=Acidiplasma cupricumulans TaxID=312540 RepID=UPI000A96F9F0|nr:hypothetical protein [Acidiplasma cupricumulans]
MSKTRISIKLNDYEYSLLYRIQTSCIMTGLLYNRAPQLNEIIKGLISFVSLNISQTHENLDMFFRTIKTDSEFPEDTLDIAVNIPKNAGNYIFIGDEKDIELLNKIGKITESMYHEKYDMPKLIRYCLHYTLYGNRKPFSENLLNDRKYKFILSVIIGNLYYLSPRTSIELLYDPLINISKIGKREFEFLRQVPLDEENYKNTIKMMNELIFATAGGEKIRVASIYAEKVKNRDDFLLAPNGRQNLYQIFSTQMEKKYNSKVSDFNFASALIGLLEVIYMWRIDSFNYIDTSMMIFLSSMDLSENFDNLSIKDKYKEIRNLWTMLPGRLTVLSIYFLEPLENLFNEFFDVIKIH